MNVLFITIDSLNRHFLKAYGQPVELAVETPNLERFAAKAATFDTHYAGSLPCMPARREFFAGVQEFLWRAWGPMEPFDTPLPLAARQAGVLTQLVTDHFHYFQHGSHGYFENYHGFEFIRGHEYDAYQTAPRDPNPVMLRQTLAHDPHGLGFINRAAYARNVAAFKTADDFFAAKVLTRTARWLRDNRDHPQWLLVVDSFDIHEPFHCPPPYATKYTDEDPNDPELVHWPYYGRTDEGQSRLSERQIAFVRAQYAGKLSMIDDYLGRVLDTLDAQALWDDTVVIITTDHGHYLGDHGWMGKPNAPMYNTLAHIPLFIWHPHSPLAGQRVSALTASIDLYATMMDAVGATPPETHHSRSLLPLLLSERDTHRDWALYGYWGSTVNITDGQHTYLHPCREDIAAHNYSSLMMNPHGWFQPPRVQTEAEAGRFLPYTHSPVWRYPAPSYTRHDAPMLFDIRTDPKQQTNLVGQDPGNETRLQALLRRALTELRAPQEQWMRLGLEP